jgi:hypothetical protein
MTTVTDTGFRESEPRVEGTPSPWYAALGSLKLALFVVALFALAVLAYHLGWLRNVWALVVPLALFALNLSAAVGTNPAFRRQTALLVFHLALIAIVLLVAAGRLTYFKGRVELSTGETFAGEVADSEMGPWHSLSLGHAAFTNEGFSIHYSPGVRRDVTRNVVSWTGSDGTIRRAVIGDQVPLKLDGYRFYTSSNKGFAPLFVWLPKGGEPRLGTIHLPAYPVHQYSQALDWVLPGSAVRIWTMLQFDEVLLDPDSPSEFHLPSRHRLVVRVGEERRELHPGDRYLLPEGELVYRGLSTWMGYTVFSDWTMPWLLAACALAVASLAWHFWRKFAAQPWNA